MANGSSERPDYFMSFYLRMKKWIFVRIEKEKLAAVTAAIVCVLLVAIVVGVVFAIAYQMLGTVPALRS